MDKRHYIMNEFIRLMPKIELHIHLEGAFPFETLFRLIQKYGGDDSIQSLEDLKVKFYFRDFLHFLEIWHWKNKFLRAPDDFELLAYETLHNLSRQNVVHVEAFYSPWDFERNGLSMEDITEAIINGCKHAEQEFGISWALIADLCRQYDVADAPKKLQQVLKYKNQGVIGIGLGGPEKEFPPDPFGEIFHKAQKEGLFVTAHAGEADGAKSIWSVIKKLRVDRIGHGVRAYEDANLVFELITHQIPLEICVTSNLKTGIIPTIYSHPVLEYLRAGLKVSLNSDDPTMFGSTITDEFLLIYKELKCKPMEIKKLCLNALDSSRLDNNKKEAIRKTIEIYWDKCPNE